MARASLCEWVVEHYLDDLREIYRLTEETGHEHGFTITGTPGDHSRTSIVEGNESTINTVSDTTTAYTPIRVGVHTHPSGGVVMSDADWKAFLHRCGLYGPDKRFPDGWRRGSVVLGGLVGDDDEFGLRSVEITKAAIGLTPDAQYAWVDDALEKLNDPSIGGIGSDQTRFEAMEPFVAECLVEVKK